MSHKVKLISTISAICMVLALLSVGVWAASTASVTLGGTVSFTADNIYAKITGTITGAQETVSLDELNYTSSSVPSDDALDTWSNNINFTSDNLITMTITIQNLSTERSLFVKVTDTVETTEETDNIRKTMKQGASDYESGTEYELLKSQTVTYTMTLSVVNTNKSASVNYGYNVDLRDANAEEPLPTGVLRDSDVPYLTLNYMSDKAIIGGYDGSCNDCVIIPSGIYHEGKVYPVGIGSGYNEDIESEESYFCSAKKIVLLEGTTRISGFGFTQTFEIDFYIPLSLTFIDQGAFAASGNDNNHICYYAGTESQWVENFGEVALWDMIFEEIHFESPYTA